MLRGVSLAPQQQRLGKGPQELPSELVNSIIGVAARASPDYGATVSTYGTSNRNINNSDNSAACLSTAVGQQSGGTAVSLSASAPPSFMTRLFRSARHRYQTTLGGQVPVFDANGNLTTSQTGVNMFRFRSLSFFYFFRAQPWTALITYSIFLYLLIVLLITATYYLWGVYCGAGMNMLASIYFTVVSLAANGGYLGEDADTMTDPTHMCYRGRTVIVMICSYVNIVFVGLVAALVVGKAEYTGKLGHRVVFSDFCTLTSIPGRIGQYRLSFRVANVDNNIPLAHGKLRLFCVTAEPLWEYRMRQKQMHLLKNSAPVKTLAKANYGSAQQLLPGGEATSSFRPTGQHTPPRLTEAMLEGWRKVHQQRHHKAGKGCAPAPDATTASASLLPPRAPGGQEGQSSKGHASPPRRHYHGHTAPLKDRHAAPGGGPVRRGSATDVAAMSSGKRGKHGSGHRNRGRRAAGLDQGKARGRRRGGGEEEKTADVDDAHSDGSSPPSSGIATRTSTPSRSSSSVTSSAKSFRSASSSAAAAASPVVERRERSTMQISPHTSARAVASTSTAAAAPGRGNTAASNVTNSSMTSKANSDLYTASPNAGMVDSSADPALNKHGVSPAPMAGLRADSGAVQVHDEEKSEQEMERVHLRVQEMRWSCAEETYLDHGDSGQLSLWYPATIMHTIDERSPLYAFMQQPTMAASLRECPGTFFNGARSEDSSVQPKSLQNGLDSARHRFQLVAVFDATEMESGSTIVAKQTYTTVDIVAHYKFSDRLVHMQPGNGEVMLDFHYFNALLPMDLIELSTTDSDL